MYNAAASSKNGVVGNKGIRSPIAPKITKIVPNVMQRYLIQSEQSHLFW